MRKVKVQVVGLAPENKSVVEFDAQFIANELQAEISGGRAKPAQVDIVTDEFVVKHNLKARYASGTFVGFVYLDDAILDEIENAS
ncbi:MAG: hypothetical protein PHQ67_10855 [Fermentimonas sp.]|nr:hypothetical protein [Fermentimonas sp.]